VPSGEIIIVLGIQCPELSAIVGAITTTGRDSSTNLPGNDSHCPGEFGDDPEILRINEELLACLGSTCGDASSVLTVLESYPGADDLRGRAAAVLKHKQSRQHSGVWIYKDPRFLRLLPFWRSVMESDGFSAKYILAMQSPHAFISALGSPSGMSQEAAYSLWLFHVVPAILHTIGAVRVIVDIDRLREQPRKEIGRIAESLPLPPPPDEIYENLPSRVPPQIDFTPASLPSIAQIEEQAWLVYHYLCRAAKHPVPPDDPEVVQRLAGLDRRLAEWTAATSSDNGRFDDLDRSTSANLDQQKAAPDAAGALNRMNAVSRTRVQHRAAVDHLTRSLAELRAEIDRLRHISDSAELRNLRSILSDTEMQIAAYTGFTASLIEMVTSVQAKFNDVQQALEQSRTVLASIREQLFDRDHQISHLRVAEASLRASMSWRITGPLRYVYGVLLRLRCRLADIFSPIAKYRRPLEIASQKSRHRSLTLEAIPRISDTARSGSIGRIVVVTHDAFPYGAQYLALSIVREFVCYLRCEVEVVTLGDGPLITAFERYSRVHNLSRVAPSGPHARALAADFYRRGFRHALVNSVVSGSFLATLKEAGVRCVALVHELRQLIADNGFMPHAKAIALYADRVVFPAAEVRESFSQLVNIAGEKCVIRPQGLFKRNPYSGNDSLKARTSLRRQLQIPEQASIVLGVGHGDLRKGADYFLQIALEAVTEAPSVHFLWVGDWEAEMLEAFEKLAKRDPVFRSRIHLAGYKRDTSMYYTGADVFALTSREDPFPNVVLEAMDAGLPVVAFSGCGGSNSLIAEGVGVNVAKGDVKAFAAAVLNCLHDAALRRQVKVRASALIKERFSFRKYVFDLANCAGLNLRSVSVVIPSFNYGRYLQPRLHSILSQQYPVREVIFLDDASTDDSLAIARRILAGANVDYKIIRNPVNSGSVVAQWRRGVEEAQGELIWIAEADDACAPQFLPCVIRGFEDPAVVLSYCQSRRIDATGQVFGEDYGEYLADLGKERWRRNYVNDGTDEIRKYLAVKNTIPNVSAVLMKREALARVLREHEQEIFPYGMSFDWRTYVRLLELGRIAFFSDALNFHRRHRASVIHRSLKDAHLCEIRETQEWIAGQCRISASTQRVAHRYTESLRKQFESDMETDRTEALRPEPAGAPEDLHWQR